MGVYEFYSIVSVDLLFRDRITWMAQNAQRTSQDALRIELSKDKWNKGSTQG